MGEYYEVLVGIYRLENTLRTEFGNFSSFIFFYIFIVLNAFGGLKDNKLIWVLFSVKLKLFFVG